MATSTTPIVQTSSFYASTSFSALQMQSLQAQWAAQKAAQQVAAQHHAAQQTAAANQNAAVRQTSTANAQLRAHQARRNLGGSFTNAPSFVSVAPPSTLTTRPPQSINTTQTASKVLPTSSVRSPPEKTWSFESVRSNEEEEELILHPKIARVSSQKKYEADAASILQGAFGNKMVTGKPVQVQDSRGAMQQRAALRMDASASMLHGLVLNRRGKQKIFLMRHGESEGNVSKYDVSDPNLTQLGLMQAKSWQEVVGEFGAEVVLVSPLRRTVQTACHAFASEDVPFVFCRSAREFGWGCAENTISLDVYTMDDMLRELPHGDEIQGMTEALCPGPDDPMDEYESLDRLKLVLAGRPENIVMVVCHYGVISALTGNRAKNGDVYECTWGEDDELKVIARHRNPLSDQGCLCG
jgi:broad specificity phosphatase PhoE|mmetsp:Transcript_104300/g.164567  ORF Transcript_104300/g.164567 Transcript_104300/m.164567 type:complete len:411 (-) Transcript_104300:142-1374(-)|eukprot:CAMPEP_0169120002 /NCGR_PEP_ID=MMETSP1015-20121227/31866_1 /TAXON_ID=342587 /ORGANISM="Karlodinium micrum, Strain CCMP2283" /LENGTH=410 /DNA_ID=CAMNT_0009182937 /DNA_START=68 /DNA_END=1300 /DNA_ORIENTATION=+